MADVIDWTVFDKYSEDTCYCGCGAVFRSHGKFVNKPKCGLVTRKPCPACGKNDDICRLSADPETFTIKGGGT